MSYSSTRITILNLYVKFSYIGFNIIMVTPAANMMVDYTPAKVKLLLIRTIYTMDMVIVFPILHKSTPFCSMFLVCFYNENVKVSIH
jgi:hypothetical protein